MENGKLLLVDIDNNSELLSVFRHNLEEILKIQTILVPGNIDKEDSYYKKISQAALNLEEFLLLNEDCIQQFSNVIYVMKPYSYFKLENLKNYINVFIPELVVLPEVDTDREISWIFGNIIAVMKLSASLFRLSDVDISNQHFILEGNSNIMFKNRMIWYGSRILLDIRGLG